MHTKICADKFIPGGSDYIFGMNDTYGWNHRDAMNPACVHFLQDALVYLLCVFFHTKLNSDKKKFSNFDFTKAATSFYASVSSLI
jgi:hypothetical protein